MGEQSRASADMRQHQVGRGDFIELYGYERRSFA